MTDEQVNELVELALRFISSHGASQRQVYDAITRATKSIYRLEAPVPDGPIHLEMGI